ncbi:hypothetical protein BD410DRAFT_776119 [Rickenella mellea]|uniref:MULE transposase domain-containing protein n=1 Tax=Rickenella mellea TaxID=50990 RepID=A0A4Y7PSG9_9AGAM|nr:hypothetical protein BD410DRAFT_776119 [Rickenella mellea]
MTRYDCEGWLRVTVSDDMPDTVRVRIRHHSAHGKYTDIAIPDNIKELISQMSNSVPSQIWDRILQENPDTELTRKQIYAHWTHINKNKWRLHENQVESAHAVMKKFDGKDIEIIPVKEEKGIAVMAFGLKEILENYGHSIAEVAMDSTWKTNAVGHELYAAVGEANGRALPLAFVFTTSTGEAAPNAKDRMLGDVLEWLAKRCPNIIFTLSDKDQSEINAFRAKIRNAKHQLCYWHAIKYLEERLAEDKAPAKYDCRRAHNLFKFIDPTWAPGVTTKKDHVKEPEASAGGSKTGVNDKSMVGAGVMKERQTNAVAGPEETAVSVEEREATIFYSLQ